MITATFYHRNQRLTGVSVSGHAGYADAGQDVICASVSASVQLTANLLTEIYQLPAEIAVEENCISISVDAIQDVNAERLLQGLLLQMQLLTEEAEQKCRCCTASALRPCPGGRDSMLRISFYFRPRSPFQKAERQKRILLILL